MPHAAVQQLLPVRRGDCGWTVCGEMLRFHSLTVGGSVLCLRNKLHIIWKVVNFFLNKVEQIFQFYTKL